MLRTALKPRWLGLLAVVVLIVVAFIQLGRWQLGVARDKAAHEAIQQAAARPPVQIDSVLRPHQPFPNKESTRRVTATGEYRSTGQVLVANRRLDGVSGYWVITPFTVESTGAVLPVLRGFVTDPDAAGPPPPGRLTILGGLAPGESPAAGEPPPAGILGSVDLSVLVNEWHGDLYNAFVFLHGEDPPPDAAHTLTKVPTPTVSTDLNWRNAAYALQWWVFAGFALWMWWRMVKDADREAREAAEEARAEARAAAREAAGEGDRQAREAAEEARTEAREAAGENGERDKDP